MVRPAAALLLILAVGACTRHVLREADPARGVQLPADHAGHGDAQTEWWHFHGHLADEAGRRYDWFLGFIKQHTDHDSVLLLPVRWFVDPFHVAYFIVTDRQTGKVHVREKHAFPDTWDASASERVLRRACPATTSSRCTPRRCGPASRWSCGRSSRRRAWARTATSTCRRARRTSITRCRGWPRPARSSSTGSGDGCTASAG